MAVPAALIGVQCERWPAGAGGSSGFAGFGRDGEGAVAGALAGAPVVAAGVADAPGFAHGEGSCCSAFVATSRDSGGAERVKGMMGNVIGSEMVNFN